MRTFEWMMVVLSLPAAGWALFGRRPWPGWIRYFTMGALLLLPVHAWFEGPHWQMAPIYLAILLLGYLLLRSRSLSKASVWLGSVSAALILGGLALCYMLPMFHLPPTTGPFAIGTSTLYFIDPSRQETHPHARPGNRQIVVQVFYPSSTTSGRHANYRMWRETDLRSTYQAVLKTQALKDSPIAAGRFPVVLFNHAWRGFRNRSSYILQELASQGFIVIGISHPYNAAVTQLQDGYLADGRDQVDLGDFYSQPPMTLEQRLGLAHNELRIQTDDDRFLLDQLEILNKTPGNPFAGHMDLTRVGAFGHSFGGSVSAELAKEDSRVLSAILLDAVMYGPVSDSGLEKPLFRIKADIADMPAGSEFSPIQVTRIHAQMARMGESKLMASFAHYGGYQVILGGIDHENFSDKGFFSPFHSLSGIGSLPQARAAALIDAYVVAFFDQTLRGQQQPLLANPGKPFPEVVRFQAWPVPPKTEGIGPSTSPASK